MKIERSAGFDLAARNATSPATKQKLATDPAGIAAQSPADATAQTEKVGARSGVKLETALSGSQTKSGLQASLNNIVEAYSIAAASEDNYAMRALAGKKAARAAQGAINGKITENESRRLEAERKNREKATEAAVAEARAGKKAQEEQTAGNAATATNATTMDGASSQQEAESVTAPNAQRQTTAPPVSDATDAAANTGEARTDTGSSENASESPSSVDVTV